MSLLELLVTIAVVAMLLTILLGVVVQTQQVLQKTNRDMSAAQLSRQIFQVLRQELRHATLASTPRFFDATTYTFQSPAAANQIRPYSQLSFVSGPSATLLSRDVDVFPGDAVFWPSQSGQAELSGQTVSGMLEGLGCLVRYGTETDGYPGFLQPWAKKQNRYRLLLHQEMPEVFARRLTQSTGLRWYNDLLPDNVDPSSGRAIPQTQVLGENVVALLTQPLQESGISYPIGPIYNSFRWILSDASDLEATYGGSYGRLPAALRLGVVILSPAAAQRIVEGTDGVPHLGSRLAQVKQSQDWAAELDAMNRELGPGYDLQLHETIVTLPRQP